MFTKHLHICIILWLGGHAITTINAKFIGEPILVSAQFEVNEHDKPPVETHKQANYAVRPVEDSINQNFENIVDEIFKEENEPYLAYRVQKEKRPKPFLNSKGEIEFHNESQTKALLQIHSTRKTTSRPGERYSPRDAIQCPCTL